MKCSEITLREAINMIEIFCPVKVVYDDVELYNDYDSGRVIETLEDGTEVYGERYPFGKDTLYRIWGLEDRTVTSINIEFVDFHHSIITLKGEWYI